MAGYLDRLPVQLMIGVGAAFDILSGTTREAPEWVLRTGLTSIFRVCQEPRRLVPPLPAQQSPLHLAHIAATLRPPPLRTGLNQPHTEPCALSPPQA